MAGWREHPKLRGRFLASAPDDLQVVVHDGGPRLTKQRPELVWVGVTGAEGDVFAGTVLNKPAQLVSVREGASIRFIAPSGGEHLVMVSEQYLRERPSWDITACDKCGLDELFDPPSELIRVLFDAPPGAIVEAFTSFCPMCGGVQSLTFKEGAPRPAPAPARAGAKPWWRFW